MGAATEITEIIEAKPLADEAAKDEKNPLKKKTDSAKKPENPDSVQLEVNLNDKPKDTKTTFNFKKGSFTSDFVKNKTEAEVSNPPPSLISPPAKETPEQIRAQIIAEEKAEANKMTIEEYEDTADFIIDLVDFGLVFLCRWISLDTTDAPYEPPKEKLQKLKKHLTRLLIRNNQKFPMGLLFFIALIGAYGTPFRKSLEHRKLVMAERAKRKRNKEEEAVRDFRESNPLKKPRGRQPK